MSSSGLKRYVMFLKYQLPFSSIIEGPSPAEGHHHQFLYVYKALNGRLTVRVDNNCIIRTGSSAEV